MKRYLPFFANIIASTIFGFSMLYNKRGQEFVGNDTMKFLAFRFVTAFLIFLLILLLRLQRVDYKGKPLRLLFFAGVCNPLISQIFETSSVKHAPTAQIAIFLGLVPVVTILLSAVINRERPTLRQTLFMLLAVCGVLLTNIGGQMAGGTALGLLLIFGAVFAISVNRVFVRAASAHFSAFEIIFATTAMGAVAFPAISLVQHAVSGTLGGYFSGLWNAGFLIPVAYMGVASSVAAFLLMTYASANLPIAVSSATSTFSTVVSIAVGALILHERLRAFDIAGAVIILLGILGISFSYNSRQSNRYGDLKKS